MSYLYQRIIANNQNSKSKKVYCFSLPKKRKGGLMEEEKIRVIVKVGNEIRSILK